MEIYGAPLVTDLHISGTPKVGQTLSAEYTFSANGSGADASTYQWQWKDGETWKNAAAAGNTARTFTLPDSYAGYSVRVVVTPKGSSHPSLTGTLQESRGDGLRHASGGGRAYIRHAGGRTDPEGGIHLQGERNRCGCFNLYLGEV